jgi:hypothetical protein
LKKAFSECSLDSFVLTGLVEQSVLTYVGFRAVEATVDQKAEILFLGQLYESKHLLFFFFLHSSNNGYFDSCQSIYHFLFTVLSSSVTAVVLGVVYGITNTFRPLPDDIFRYGQDMIFFPCYLQ